MVAVTTGGEAFAARRALERLEVKVDSEVTLEVAELTHLLMANFTLEDVSIYAARLLANVVLADAVAHYVVGGLHPIVIEDACRLSLLRLTVLFLILYCRFICYNLILEEALNCIRTGAIACFCCCLRNMAYVLEMLNRVLEEGARDFGKFLLACGFFEHHFRGHFVELAHLLVLEIMVSEDLVCASEHGGTDAQVCHLALEFLFLIWNFTSCCLLLR